MQHNIDNIFEEGITFYEQGKLEEAEKSFLLALQLDHNSDEIKYNLALVYLEMKKYALVDKLIAQIREIECDEIVDELEKAGYDNQPHLPSNIPDFCSQCEQFDEGSVIKEDEGLCLFYKINVGKDNHCHVYTLVEEGKIPVELIQYTLNTAVSEQVKLFHEQLDDQYLPEILFCPDCHKELSLTETERMTQKYSCPECGSAIDIRQKVQNLNSEFYQKPDSELFQILVHANEYKTEYLFAARKEIRKRNLDLLTNEEFQQTLINS